MAALDAEENDLEAVRKRLEDWFDSAMDRVSGWYKRSTQIIIFTIACAIVFSLNLNAISIANTLYHDQNLRAATVAAASGLKSEEVEAGAALDTLQKLQLPIGWHGQGSKWLDKWGTSGFSLATEVITPLLGLLLTAFAATLGAPFWFDVLNKIMVIRGTVKPHEKSLEEGSEDRQPTALALRAAASVPVAGQLAHHVTLHGSEPDNDVDDCNLGDEDPTPDEALPASTGGVR